MIYSDILRSVKTIEHLRDLLYEIEIILESLFKTESNAFEKSLNSISANTLQTLRQAFLTDNISTDDKTKIKEYLIGLKSQFQKLKVLKLTIAFEPSKNSIDNLFSWVLKNEGLGIVLDIKTDKTILGGTIIEYEGKYKDFSLKKKLEETFGTKRKEILTLLSS